MYRVVYSENYHKLAGDYNALIRENREHSCKLVNLTELPSKILYSTFVLSAIAPDDTAQRIGEYKMLFYNPDGIPSSLERFNKEKVFERQLNAIEAEGWVLAFMWAHYPVAVFYKIAAYSASAMGFSSEEEFQAFKRSGCETRQQYEQYQKLIASYTAKLDEIHKDAAEAYKLGRFGEYIRLAFLELEQIIISMNAVLRHSDKPEKDTPPTHLLEGMCGVYQVQLVDPQGFARWRAERNCVVHENKKIDAKGAKTAQKFFEDTIRKLEKLLREMPYDLNERVNHGGFDPNLNARVDRSGFALLAGHEGEIADLGEEDRKDADNYDDDD